MRRANSRLLRVVVLVAGALVFVGGNRVGDDRHAAEHLAVHCAG